MCLDNIPTKHLSSTHTAIVRSLWRRETVRWPAVWPSTELEKSVFLLKTKPELVLSVGGHQLVGISTEVVRIRLAIGHPGLTHDENVVAETEGVGIHCDGSEVDIGIVARSLAGRGAVEVPFGKFFDVFRGLVQGLALKEVRIVALPGRNSLNNAAGSNMLV